MLAIQLMAEENVHRVIAVDEQQRLAGIVTPIDVCRAIFRQASVTLGQTPLNRAYVNLARPAP